MLLREIAIRFCQVADHISEFIGRFFGWFILIIASILCWEILMRSVFDSPTLWAHESSQYFFAVYFTLGGAYALKKGTMVKVDVIVNSLKPRTKALIDAILSPISLLFIGVLLWKGLDLAIHSVQIREASQTPCGPHIYPLKITLVVGAVVLGIQSLAEFIRNMVFGISGRKLQ
jgi:TRAP-type mannitol/chloroaromatic compound transport system permease small subunit